MNVQSLYAIKRMSVIYAKMLEYLFKKLCLEIYFIN